VARPPKGAIPVGIDRIFESAAAERVGRALLLVAQDLRTVVDRELDSVGVTMQQAEVLVWIHVHGATSPNLLAPALGIDAPGMTRLVDRLEAKRYVARQRVESDGRSIQIALTPSGHRLAPRVLHVAEDLQRRLFGDLSEAEIRSLKHALSHLRSQLRTALDKTLEKTG